MSGDEMFTQHCWHRVEGERAKWERKIEVRGYIWTEEVCTKPPRRTTYVQKVIEPIDGGLAKVIGENSHLIGQMAASQIPMAFGGGITKLVWAFQAQRTAEVAAKALSGGVEKDRLLMITTEIAADLDEIVTRDATKEAENDVLVLKSLIKAKSRIGNGSADDPDICDLIQ